MPEMIIRPLRSQDIEKTFNLVRNVSEEFLFPTYSEEGRKEFVGKLGEIKNKLADPTHISFVADDKGMIIGMVQGRVRDGKASVGLLFVDKKHHRNGIASLLMEKIESEYRKQTDTVKLYSSVHGLPFYTQIGYRRTTGLRIKKGIVYYPMRKKINLY